MIRKECFTTEWIEKVSSELHYNDNNLIEKVIRALSLLEMLVMSGCPFVFKGGTALMLILGKSANHLSINIERPGTFHTYSKVRHRRNPVLRLWRTCFTNGLRPMLS